MNRQEYPGTEGQLQKSNVCNANIVTQEKKEKGTTNI